CSPLTCARHACIGVAPVRINLDTVYLSHDGSTSLGRCARRRRFHFSVLTISVGRAEPATCCRAEFYLDPGSRTIIWKVCVFYQIAVIVNFQNRILFAMQSKAKRFTAFSWRCPERD